MVAFLVWSPMLLRAAPPGSPQATAAAPEPPVIDAALAGQYALEGVMETGSEVWLKPDGHFQWYWSYGAVDLAAQGRWHRDGTTVVLQVDEFRGPEQFPEGKFDTMRLRIDGADLVPAWPWENGAERGRYSRE